MHVNNKNKILPIYKKTIAEFFAAPCKNAIFDAITKIIHSYCKGSSISYFSQTMKNSMVY